MPPEDEECSNEIESNRGPESNYDLLDRRRHTYLLVVCTIKMVFPHTHTYPHTHDSHGHLSVPKDVILFYCHACCRLVARSRRLVGRSFSNEFVQLVNRFKVPWEICAPRVACMSSQSVVHLCVRTTEWIMKARGGWRGGHLP